MPNNWNRAFGLYLRTLRERKGLSLHDVASLSQAFVETVNKGYLSRCENGHQRLAMSKVIPLSRIYKVSAETMLGQIECEMK
ncbi:MAG: helix-turn-helix transcriptional regulator, partial [Deltaproteobacteria bacterium]|nr:helix-turn-helix transcriptional regulator [Deltaproteobacteria bacterium]